LYELILTFALSAKNNSNCFSLITGIFERVIFGFSSATHPGPLILENFRAALIELGET
jgi:hypothetical protein